ncbi:serine/threonine protein kinase [Tuwongella immobilis]|uniref:Uncharacterized protein n=1 Tax=Tuwongella immobilis TaxID=692036 RepID=A0A6C2YIU2_9BACT|nr:serine/threonine-protein kinase [Tuwongella immobilis]VIP01284.1 serine threonine protein kinase : Serine/threonine protein kinase OS=Planctomyces maris DSM 8797 GN=PM8797T_21568 PE=4 SV=1: Pkinase [Tuwongella immobilis]VTR97994.1 serine threonine protein kinase : Serine/threonine protein kinase OS=Planctomyces maris DSM 8797 GN=PM8797T_21568 PE=4 SV=1: Pkinase [Tuwongella immobilis]
MSKRDVTGIGQLAVRLNLVQPHQLDECLDELEHQGTTPSKESIVRALERKGYLTSYQGGKLLKGDPDGYFLGGYRILYRIASGSFGRVFRADDPRSGSIVAIKVLRNRWMDKPDKIELFEREGKVGLTLKHPGIVEILAVNRDPATGQYFIVMEFIEGGNLKNFMSIRKKLELPEALRILEETASGLAYAATRGLTHRDIKLTNILISSQGQAKLVDFGLAEITGGELEDDTTVARTVDYAGLERATNVKQGDLRSDIYFLGCVFFELITGRPLLETTRSSTSRMAARRFDVAAKVRADLADFPPQILRLVERMTALEPGGRFQTSSALVETVRKIQTELIGRAPGELRLPAGPPTLFILEKSPKLQDVFRDKFKAMGYRVLIATDPARAAATYQLNPFHALIVDAGTVFEDGIKSVDAVLNQADQLELHCGSVILLNEDQTELALLIPDRPNVATLVRPMTLKQLKAKLLEVLPLPEPNADADSDSSE